MKKITVILVLLALLAGGCAVQEQEEVKAAATQQLALVNPGFEGEYVVVPGGYAAYGWATYYKEGTTPPLADSGGSSALTRRPEFKPIEARLYPNRVFEGDKAQVAFAFFGIMDAAFSQRVAVEKGQRVQWSIEGHGWCTNTDDPSHHTGDVWISIGIGAEGQTWPWEHGIVWRRYDWTPAEYRTYTSRDVVAEADMVTLFVLVTNKWALKHNDVYLDGARAWVILDDGTQPTPEPLPTYTPRPTLTPRPTYTPLPTLTPYPTPAVTPCPTGEPGTGECDYGRVRSIVETAVAEREPVKWPR